ncbi:MAG: glycosyltransferase family 2 protein [Muribaculaceae bacterium]|nr:glycosyltransferase family 2 protein [Muribaculaceae bacterium]
MDRDSSKISVHVITPVKDSIESTLLTVDAILASAPGVDFTFTIFNDNSTPENTARLTALAREKKFSLVNISELTDHPSPNYLLVLRLCRKRALEAGVPLLIVESDVIVAPDTIPSLVEISRRLPKCGIAAAVTVDDCGEINYPYAFARKLPKGIVEVNKHCSFCCSLLTPALLRAVDFDTLDPEKHWHDVTISHRSLQAELRNYLFTAFPVIHRPHASRPWKQLKYKNPLKYYWIKYTKGFDKI